MVKALETIHTCVIEKHLALTKLMPEFIFSGKITIRQHEVTP